MDRASEIDDLVVRELGEVRAVEFDLLGNNLIADTINYRIRKIWKYLYRVKIVYF